MNTLNRPDLSDIHEGDWVERLLPGAWRPYTRLARLDRPRPEVNYRLFLANILTGLLLAASTFMGTW